jgi:hypothetical protein
MRAQIVDNKDLVKDMKSGAVINTNQTAFQAARERAAKAKQEKERLDNLEKEVVDIKEMLKQILQKVS